VVRVCRESHSLASILALVDEKLPRTPAPAARAAGGIVPAVRLRTSGTQVACPASDIGNIRRSIQQIGSLLSAGCPERGQPRRTSQALFQHCNLTVS
jgi:hypothetical protein